MKTRLRQALVALLLLMPEQTRNAAADIESSCFFDFTPKEDSMKQFLKIGGIRVSCYQLVKAQTDSTPLQAKWFDYRGKNLNRYFGKHCALSMDLIKKFGINGGDTVYVATQKGGEVFPLIVTDVTNSRWKNTIDVVEKKGIKYLHKEAEVYIKKRK